MLQLSEKTYSLWGYLIANNDEFTNPLYDPSSQSDVLRPTIAPQFIKFWSGLYCRFENGKKKFIAFTEKCDHEYLIITLFNPVAISYFITRNFIFSVLDFQARIHENL